MPATKAASVEIGRKGRSVFARVVAWGAWQWSTAWTSGRVARTAVCIRASLEGLIETVDTGNEWSGVTIELLNADGSIIAKEDTDQLVYEVNLSEGDAIYMRIRLFYGETEERIWISPFFAQSF